MASFELSKGSTLGYLYEGKSLRGLWFASRSDASNPFQIKMCIASQEAAGFTTSMGDYAAATSGACPIQDGPAHIGGFLLMFPSARS